MSTTRKELLQRRQRGRAILPQWKSAFEAAANQSVTFDSFLDLEETERLRAGFFDKVRDFNCRHRFAMNDDFGKMTSDLQSIMARPDGRRVVLFHSKDKFIGALKVDAETVLSALEAIWRIVEEDLCVATIDLSSGFCLERNYYDEAGEYFSNGVLELTTWGDFAVN